MSVVSNTLYFADSYHKYYKVDLEFPVSRPNRVFLYLCPDFIFKFLKNKYRYFCEASLYPNAKVIHFQMDDTRTEYDNYKEICRIAHIPMVNAFQFYLDLEEFEYGDVYIERIGITVVSSVVNWGYRTIGHQLDKSITVETRYEYPDGSFDYGTEVHGHIYAHVDFVPPKLANISFDYDNRNHNGTLPFHNQEKNVLKHSQITVN